ncbi:MAG TPA: DUF3822 domain-containing protein, partial [Flavobacterium sp.]|nr:DUF3822 domain-containing protein [Flavobacterium sp.]
TCEQLQLNPEYINVFLLGKISENDAYFNIAYKFIRNCQLLPLFNISKTLQV